MAGFSQFMQSQAQVLIQQNALIFEHMEYALYNGALSQYDDKAFANAGFAPWVRGRFVQIKEHEAAHVAGLVKVLDSAAPKPCNYSFPYTDVQSFVSLASTIEGLSVSSKLGALQKLDDKTGLVTTGSLASAEVAHRAWISSAVTKGGAWNLPYETPLTSDDVWSIAGNFIADCPTTNPARPTASLPSLGLSPNITAAGHAIFVSLNGTAAGEPADPSADTTPLFLAYYAGLDVYHSRVRHGRTHVPAALANAGTVYVALVANMTNTWYNGTAVSALGVLQIPSTSGAAWTFPTEVAGASTPEPTSESVAYTTDEAAETTFSFDMEPTTVASDAPTETASTDVPTASSTSHDGATTSSLADATTEILAATSTVVASNTAPTVTSSTDAPAATSTDDAPPETLSIADDDGATFTVADGPPETLSVADDDGATFTVAAAPEETPVTLSVADETSAPDAEETFSLVDVPADPTSSLSDGASSTPTAGATAGGASATPTSQTGVTPSESVAGPTN